MYNNGVAKSTKKQNKNHEYIKGEVMSKKLIIFGGPLGVGKSTIMKEILNDKELNSVEILNTTTRKPRDIETAGVDRHFTTVEKFEEMIKSGEMIEWIKFEGNGQYYGVESNEIHSKLETHDFGVIDAMADGLKIFKEVLPKEGIKMKSIFIKHPSKEVLEQRIRDRGTENEEEIQKRVSMTESYLKYEDMHDYTVVNDNLETAVAEAKEIIKKIIA